MFPLNYAWCRKPEAELGTEDQVKQIAAMAQPQSRRGKKWGWNRQRQRQVGQERQKDAVQLVPGCEPSARAEVWRVYFGNSGFPVQAEVDFLSIFILLFILHPTVSSASLPLTMPQPAVLSSLTCSLLAVAELTDCARVPKPPLLRSLSFYYTLVIICS